MGATVASGRGLLDSHQLKSSNDRVAMVCPYHSAGFSTNASSFIGTHTTGVDMAAVNIEGPVRAVAVIGLRRSSELWTLRRIRTAGPASKPPLSQSRGGCQS